MKFVIAACLAFLLAITHGAACSCVSIPFADELQATHAVFVGRCLSKTYRPDLLSYEYAFEVERTWKNRLPSHVSVVSPADGAACGYFFNPDYRYVVWTSARFVSKGRQMLETTLCTRTTTADSSEATTQIAALEQWQQTTKRAWWIGSGLALFIVATSIVAWCRRSSHVLAKQNSDTNVA